MPVNNDFIPLYQQRAIQALLRAGMTTGSILDALQTLGELKAIDNIPYEVLPFWIGAVGEPITQLPDRSNAVASSSHNDKDNEATPILPTHEDALPSSPIANSPAAHPAVEPPSWIIPVANDDNCNPIASAERHLSSLSNSCRQRKVSQFIARHCIGSDGKCTAKSKKVWKYQGPWESHFRAEHLNDFLDVLTCTYVCFCSLEDRGTASNLMEHIWDTHMVNSANAQPMASEV